MTIEEKSNKRNKIIKQLTKLVNNRNEVKVNRRRLNKRYLIQVFA